VPETGVWDDRLNLRSCRAWRTFQPIHRRLCDVRGFWTQPEPCRRSAEIQYTFGREQLHAGVVSVHPGIAVMVIVEVDLTRTVGCLDERLVVVITVMIVVITVIMGNPMSSEMIMDVGADLAGHEANRKREHARKRHKTPNDVQCEILDVTDVRAHREAAPVVGAASINRVPSPFQPRECDTVKA
jgi:hypothetical protein